ncbi:response regulator [Vagococcus sp. BWB3-3]|uniref:Response regulator n=1 Tax=Vagococcus allomyrinae TaxID=2794353 RepID=A0A940SU18_9ENTE|nr:response regulator [Vagococcus allomyrinae]MBP1040274.1 response regulator [Vagococcus allomyrinae]
MYTYLIVDDEALIRKGTRKKIEKMADAPICVGEAANGQEALALIQATAPDFIITDMDMPVMDGTALLDVLIKDYPDLKIIVISAYENFNYAQKALQAKAVNYLLKPFGKEDIRQIILETMTLLSHEETALALSNSLEIDFLSHYLIGNAPLQKMPEPLAFQLKDRLLTVVTLVNLSTAGHNYLTGSTSFIIPHPQFQQLTLLVDLEEAIRPHLEELLTLSPGALIGISESAQVETLPKAYKKTIKALNSASLSGSESVLTYQKRPYSTGFHHPKTDELIFFVESGQTERLTSLIGQIFNEIHQQNLLTYGEIKDYGLSLIEQTKSILNEHYQTTSNLTLPHIYDTIYESIFSIDELQRFFSDFLANISVGFSYEKIYGSDDVIENVKLYIDKYYYKNIQLDFLSDIFFINSSYLSTLFKERSAVKFTDYLNAVRITHAKELLLNSERKVYQVSQAVGYDNPKYFFRIFKKATGFSPEQYKLAMKHINT